MTLAERPRWNLSLPGSSYLKEPLQPPNLKNAFSEQHPQLKDTPPLHSPVRAFCSIPMRPLPDHDV